MKTIVLGRNIEVTEALKETAERKLSKFDNYFKKDVEATVTFSTQKERQTAEITITLPDDTLIRAEETSQDMYTSIDMAVDKLARQLQKHKTKLEKRLQGNESIKFEKWEDEVLDAPEDEATIKIVKSKKFGIKPMHPEEAVLQMEMLGHDFFVFLNGETDEVNVVYKRKKGDFGLIEPVLE